MKTPIRWRFVMWLSALLLAFVITQTTVFVLHELHEWRAEENFDWEEEVKEVLLLVGIDAVIFPIILLVVWVVSGRMLRPLKNIADTADYISAGQFDERVPVVVEHDEIGSMAQTLNRAFDSYEEAVKKLGRFSSDASHQLRTPLTAMRSAGEVCLQKKRKEADYVECISSMLEDVERLTQIVEQLLSLSRMDEKDIHQGFQQIDLSQVIEEAVERYRPLGEEKGVTISVTSEGACALSGDEVLLHQAVANVLDNAIRHTPSGGAIDVDVRGDGSGMVAFQVSDTGPGIPESYRASIFDRFKQVAPGDSNGAGLGLAIVADIIRIHRGSIEAVGNQRGGATIRASLPARVLPA